MGSSLSTGSTVLHSEHGVSISTRNDPSSGMVVQKELGLVSARATGEWEGEEEDLAEKAKNMACQRCEQLGGDALLSCQVQLVPKNNHAQRFQNSIHIVGTCVKLAKKGQE